MKNKILVFILGAVMGVICTFLWYRITTDNYSYIKLKEDYCTDNGIRLPSGTLIRFDEAFSEGFTRYVLYVNLPDSYFGDIYLPKHNKQVIPYWLKIEDRPPAGAEPSATKK